MSSIKSSPQVNCPACGHLGTPLHGDVEDYYFGSPGKWQISACSNNCKSVWLDPAPLPEDIGKAYLNYHTHQGKQSTTWRERFVKILGKLIEIRFQLVAEYRKSGAEKNLLRFMYLRDFPAGRLLDVGCGGGRFLRRMHKIGWDVEGVDFDPKATERVKTKYGIKAFTGDVRELNIGHETYDAITMSHAIEHAINPESLLLSCRSLLKPGGHIVIVTPNAESIAHRRFGKYWRGLEAPRHIQVFSRRGLVSCLERAGFRVANATTFSFGADAIYRISREVRRNRMQLGFNPVKSIMDSRIAMLAESRHLARAPDTGEDLLVIAVKD